ncbi:MAG: hypothetical protein PSV17_02205 [Methylotenera sp.]|uniref:hypothetical protein n=1 Tax=Methylotenera sp. TaxID=2051956 RepID=UPI0024877246|nr:hypothetical protein [Methylotenera sp.]MDI1308231.1 hypothetical protein [Methylotenera sp.]
MRLIIAGRLLRFWLLIGLPICIYFGYLTFQEHNFVISQRIIIDKSELYLNSIKNTKLSDAQMPLSDEAFLKQIDDIHAKIDTQNEAVRRLETSLKKREFNAIICLTIIIFPLLILIGWFFFRWIWFGNLNLVGQKARNK